MYNNEKITGNWTTNLAMKGFKASGKLTVTEAAVYFLPATILWGSISQDMALFQEQEAGVFICRLTPESILSATAMSKLLSKRIILHVKDQNGQEQEVVIDYGMMSIKPIVEALSGLIKVEGAT